MRKTEEGEMGELCWFFMVSLSKCWKTWSESKVCRFWLKVWMQRIKTEHKDKETEREKANTKQFFIGSSHNTGVVQSPCTSKGFHYNHSGLQIAQGHLQETSLLKDTCLRIPCSRKLPKDFMLKDNSKILPFCSIIYDWDFPLLNHNWPRLPSC